MRLKRYRWVLNSASFLPILYSLFEIINDLTYFLLFYRTRVHRISCFIQEVYMAWRWWSNAFHFMKAQKLHTTVSEISNLSAFTPRCTLQRTSISQCVQLIYPRRASIPGSGIGPIPKIWCGGGNNIDVPPIFCLLGYIRAFSVVYNCLFIQVRHCR